VAGLAATFGSGAMTNSIDEIEYTDLILATGTNTTENHPVIGAKVKRAVKRGADSIAGLASARCSNEENYLFQKFMRAAIGTNNVDHCARL